MLIFLIHHFFDDYLLLNFLILVAPVCKDPPNFVYYVGINQTINVECRILNANPTKIAYEWMLESINVNSNLINTKHNGSPQPSAPIYSLSNFVANKEAANTYDQSGLSGELLSAFDILSGSKQTMRSQQQQPADESLTNDNILDDYLINKPIAARYSAAGSLPPTAVTTESFTNRFKWKPTSMNNFGEIKCKATNEIGSTVCTYEIKLGGAS
jgi:hypothetical protein